MIGRLKTVALDCPDPLALARFYSALLGRLISSVEDDWVTVGSSGPEGGVSISFQLAPDHVAPTWPDPARPQQLHLDIEVDDIDEAEPKVLALGARRLPGSQDTFRVYADPAGHPFCLVFS